MWVKVSDPASLGVAQRILAIPVKKTHTEITRHLSRSEVDALIDAPDQRTPRGRRDRTLLPWCLVTPAIDKPARELINLYAKRWGIECQFRDSKDIRFGMGMSEVHVSTPDRRDRLWLINAFAVALLTLLGAAGEALGFDRLLKSNTTKRRTHSLLRQGIMLFQLIPTMPEHRLLPLVEKFAELLNAQPVFVEMFGAI